MTISEHRYKIGKFILIANLLIFVLVFVIFAFQGFTPGELEQILKFLIPIKSVYMTAVVKFVIANRDILRKKDDVKQINSLYKNVSSLIIYSHIILLTFAIIIGAIFRTISFETLTYSIVIIETFFGAYIGIIITDMFNVNRENGDSLGEGK